MPHYRFFLAGHTFVLIRMCAFFMCLLLMGGCVSDNPRFEYEELTLLRTHQLEIEDPSGLSFTADGSALWTVSDQRGGGVYRISFTGEILERLDYTGDDLEGITVNPNSGTLFVVEERLREVRELDKQGRVLRSIRLDIPGSIPNDGLEGITYNANRNELYVVNEKNPMLFIRLSAEDLSIIQTRQINFLGIFSITDVSGVFYDKVDHEIWFISDESAKIVVTDRSLTPRRAYRTNLSNGEGIAVDVDQRLIYAVNDDTAELIVFRY